MPLRGWFAKRGANHPVAYSMLTLSLGMVVCMIIAVVISVQASNRAIRQNIAQERAAQEEAKRATCEVIVKVSAAYQEDPPVTAAGKNAAAAWRELGRNFNC